MDGDVRLVPETPPTDGKRVREGRLEICYRGIWGAVLDPLWTGVDAGVACRSLGFSGLGE